MKNLILQKRNINKGENGKWGHFPDFNTTIREVSLYFSPCAFIGMGALDTKEAAAGFISMTSQKHPKIMFYVV